MTREFYKLGEIKKARNIGKTGYGKYIYHACIDCGKERWVLLSNNKENLRCNSCKQRGDLNLRYWVHKYQEESPNWKGGQTVRNDYVYVFQPDHPRADSNGYVKRAILVLEEKLGRPLFLGAISHHINGVKDDDRPENLEEVSRYEHQSIHSKKILRARSPNGRFIKKE